MGSSQHIKVEVAYATPDKQLILSVELASNAQVIDAVQQSGILRHFPDIDEENLVVGIFGERVSLQSALKDGDRVEIYRPLQVKPMQARRRRAVIKNA